MATDNWERIESLFFAALDLPPAEHPAFLDDACAGDTALREEVEAMLAAHERNHTFEIENRLLANDTPAADPLLGTMVGPYRLQRLIGRGGMGEVYLAERNDDHYQQQVALKLVRPGLHPAGLLARFRQERQILARLAHPNIARLLDGGRAQPTPHHPAGGWPYLVMEYVQGVPITQYCDAYQLSVRDRLQLFSTICAAVQFAHRNLVVHRDLKPSNILVVPPAGGPDGGGRGVEGTVKLLDFGIAKLLDPDQAGVTAAQTLSEVRVMTPEYAAPEQVRGEAVTTATDVYALGILLYELLTGHRPYNLPSRIQAEVERAICQDEPTRPSTVVGTAAEVRQADGTTARLTPEQVGAARRTPIGRLRRLLRGDLDNMVMMALRKEPERRYGSAGQLAEDIERYLHGQPVIAQKATLRYRTSKFIQRNRMGVLVAGAFVLVLLGFSVITAVQMRTVAQERDRAGLERDKAEQVVAVLVNLFETSNPNKVPGGDTLRVGDFLAQGEAQVLASLDDQPDVQARMKHVLSQMYLARSQYGRAQALLEEALAQQRTLEPHDGPDAAAMLHDLARLTFELGDREAARTLFTESLDLHRQLFGTSHAKVAQAMQELASTMDVSDEQYHLLEEALAMRRRLLPAGHTAVANGLNQLGIYHYKRQEYAEAARYWQEALDIVTRQEGEDHPATLAVMNNLVAAYNNQERLAEAEALGRRVLDVRRRVLGPETRPFANSLSMLGNILARQGRQAEAEQTFRESLALWQKIMGPNHWRTSNDLRNLAMALHFQQRQEEGLPYLEAAIASRRTTHGPEAREVGYMMGQHSRLLLALGRTDEALATARAAYRIVEAAPDGGPALADVRLWLGQSLLAGGSAPEAEPLLQAALDDRRATMVAGHHKIAEAQCLLGQALAAQGRYDEAEPLLRAGYARYKTWGMATTPTLEKTRHHLYRTYTALQQPEQAALYR